MFTLALCTRKLSKSKRTNVSYEGIHQRGKYPLFTNFKSSGVAQALNRQEIEVHGHHITGNEEGSNKWISEDNGYIVTLENGNDFKINRTQSVEISVEKDRMKLQESDMQQYLGASAHIVMIGKDGKEFLQIHPVSDSRFPIYAETHIEKVGVYRMWVQFKIDGQVLAADFTIDVVQGGKIDNEKSSRYINH